MSAHPDDVATQARILAELRARRLAAGIRQRDAAEAAGVAKGHMSTLELNVKPGVMVATLHRMAGAIGAELVCALDGLPDPPVENRASANLLAMFETTGDPSYLTARLLVRIGAARRWLDLSLAEVGLRAGVTESAVHHLENAGRDVKLATVQRLCRALGGQLRVSLVDAAP